MIKTLTALLGQPLQHRQCTRQNWAHVQRPVLPGHGLAFTHLELARPLPYLAPVQTHQRMRVIVLGHFPDLGGADGDAKLFGQLAAQRLLDGFAGL